MPAEAVRDTPAPTQRPGYVVLKLPKAMGNGLETGAIPVAEPSADAEDAQPTREELLLKKKHFPFMELPSGSVAYSCLDRESLQLTRGQNSV